MIYAWRDAREDNLVEWEARFGAKRVHLLGNYRCPRRIVGAANALISRNPRPADQADEPYSRVTDREGHLRVTRVRNRWEEAEQVAAIVADRLAAGVLPPDVAILAANRFSFDEIANALETRQIRYVRVGEDPASARPLARALRAALVLAVSPDNARARDRLQRLVGGTLAGTPLEVADLERRLIALPSAREMLRELARLLELEADDPDVLHAHNILGLAEREFGRESPTATGRRIALEWHRLGRQLQREADAVKVMTTFAAKGPEFDTVILPAFGADQVPYIPRNVTPTEALCMNF